MKFANEKVVSAQSMGASFDSPVVLLDQIYGFSFHAIFTGSPVGTFKLQCSNDDVKNASSIVNWTDIPSSGQIISAAGDIMWNVEAAFYKWVKVVYTRTSGTGSCDITLFSKGV